MKKYEQIQQIGKGSFGIVYKCRVRHTGQFVALKLISTYGKSQAELDQLEKEIDVLKNMHHPNIIQVFEDFKQDGNFCISTELAQSDLFDIIQKTNYDHLQLNQQQLISFTTRLQMIAHQILSAINYLHSKKIVHRDIKPQNILLVDGICKVCDFGFARQLSAHTVALDSLKGSPIYLAPEIAKQRPYAMAADIWSFGVLMFELSTKNPPFVANDQLSLIKFLSEDKLDAPFKLYKIFQDNSVLKNFIELAMQRNPDKRFTAEKLLNHPFIQQAPQAIVMSQVAKIEKRNWVAILGQTIHENTSEQISKQVDIKFTEKQRASIFADVKHDEQLEVQNQKQIEMLQQKSAILKLIIDVFRYHGKKIDEKFASKEIYNMFQNTEQLRYDYDSIVKLKFEGEKSNYKVLNLKLDFLIYYFVTMERKTMFQFIDEIKQFKAKDIDQKSRKTLILLMRILCGLLGCTISFQIPLLFGEHVEYPYDVFVHYEDMIAPRSMEDTIQYTSKIHMTYALASSFQKYKSIVDILENMMTLWKENTLNKNLDGIELKINNHLVNLFQTSICAIFGLQQCLYNKYIIFLPSNNRIKTKTVGLNDEIHRSINYDVNVFELQQKAMPNLGKKQIPEYLLNILSEEEKAEFLNSFDTDKYFFQTLSTIEEHSQLIIDALISCSKMLIQQLPSLASTTFAYIVKNMNTENKQTQGVNIQQLFEEFYNNFVQSSLNQMFLKDQLQTPKDSLLPQILEQIKLIFSNNQYNIDQQVDLVYVKYMFVNIFICLQQLQQILLPFYVMRQQSLQLINSDNSNVQNQQYNLLNNYHPIHNIATIKFSSLISEQIIDEISLLDNLYINQNLPDIQNSDVMNKYKQYFMFLISTLPFLKVVHEVSSPIQNAQTDEALMQIKQQKQEQEKYLLIEYTKRSNQIIMDLFYPQFLQIMPLFANFLKDESPYQIQRQHLIQFLNSQTISDTVAYEEIHNDPEQMEFAKLLIDKQYPQRGFNIFITPNMAAAFSIDRFTRVPLQIHYSQQSFNSYNVFKFASTYIYGLIGQSGNLPKLFSQAFFLGILYEDGGKIKVHSQFLISQTNQHLAVKDTEQVLNNEFLYRGQPLLINENQSQQEQDYITQKYLNDYQSRVQILQLLCLLAKSKDFSKSIAKLQYQLDCSNDYISFLTLLFTSSLWLQALQHEEEARQQLLIILLQNDTENQMMELLLNDCQIIKKLIQIKQNELSNLFIVDNFIQRLIIYYQFVQQDVIQSQEHFSYNLNAVQQFDINIFNIQSNQQHTKQQTEQEQVQETLDKNFKYVDFYLSTGTLITLPVVNAIRENEISISLIAGFSELLSILFGRKEYTDISFYQIEQIQNIIVTSLITIIDCYIVEYYQINDLSSNNIGLLDGIISFMQIIQLNHLNQQEINQYTILINKLSIIMNLSFNNSFLEAYQSAHQTNHHIDYSTDNILKFRSQSQLRCASQGCLNCIYTMNNLQIYKDEAQYQQYYDYLLKIHAKQANRNYSEVFYHWNYLISFSGLNTYIKLISNIVKYHQKHQLSQIPDFKMDQLQLKEIIRVLIMNLDSKIISQYMFIMSQQAVEQTVNNILQLLFQLDKITDNQNLQDFIFEIFVEYNVIDRIINLTYYLKNPQILVLIYALISYLIQKQSYCNIIFGCQYVTSGAIQIDYIGCLFNEQMMKLREAQFGSAQVIQILSILSSFGKCFKNILQGCFVKEMLMRPFSLNNKYINQQLLNFCSNVSLHDSDMFDMIEPFVDYSIDQIKSNQCESQFMVQCLSLARNVINHKDTRFVERVGKTVFILKQYLLDPGMQNEYAIKSLVFSILAKLYKFESEKQKIVSVQLDQLLFDFIRKIDRYDIQMQPILDAILDFKRQFSTDGKQQILKILKNWNDQDVEEIYNQMI